jgi:hypothetical protein
VKNIRSFFFMKNAIDFAFNDADDAKPKPEYEPFAARVQKSKDREADALFERALAIADAKNKLQHGTFHEFLRDPRVNIKPRMAEHLIEIARAEDGRALARLGIAKAVQMLRLDIEQRRKLFAEHCPERLSASALRGLVDEVLGKKKTAKRPVPAVLVSETELAWAAGVLQLDLPIECITGDSIDSAFRALAQVLHPDKGLATDGTFFRTLVKAREVLDEAFSEGVKAAA